MDTISSAAPSSTETNEMLLATVSELDPVKTFECGQCFRWNLQADGSYFGVAGGYAAKISSRDGAVYLRASGGSTDFWRLYFDLDTDYAAIDFGDGGGEFFENCREYGSGIRILRQEPWEALCSFIISQRNNIPRIKGIVETLCREFGTAFVFGGRTCHTFPPPETLALLDTSDLAPLRCGYRGAYILAAAKAVASGELELQSLAGSGYETAYNALTAIRGVGKKVANCVILYGLHHMSGFPVDVWMQRAISEHLPPDFNPDSLGQYAGLAQQYIFYYTREKIGRSG